MEHLGEVQLAEHILHQLGRSNTATALVHRLFGEFSEISVFGGQFLLKKMRKRQEEEVNGSVGGD